MERFTIESEALQAEFPVCQIQISNLADCINFTEITETVRNIRINQPENGYRFSIDPLLLVAEVTPEESENILDIGTGCGVISLLLAMKFPNIKITAVEIQSNLSEIALQNIATNNLAGRIRLVNRDIRQVECFDTNEKFDRVISNPPYKKKGTGRLNPDIQKAIARHEITLNIDEFVLSATRFLETGGVLNLIYPAARVSELLSVMKKNSIEPQSIKFIRTANPDISMPESRNIMPRLVIVTGIKVADTL